MFDLMDPEHFCQVLKVLPHHAGTLSEIYHHRADYADRSKFRYECAFVGAFNLTSGANRLDFDMSRTDLSSSRSIDKSRSAMTRMCSDKLRVRSLYALDHGHISMARFRTPITSQSRLECLNLWDLFEPKVEKRVKDVKSPYMWRVFKYLLEKCFLVCSLFVREEESGDKERSTRTLEYAVCTPPSVGPLFADKTDISLSGEIYGHVAFRIQTDRRYVSNCNAYSSVLTNCIQLVAL
ncbi:hypothetical protein C8Q74DRAFT_275982 [Fomes fomentarius]|nr:hypothetical protein C8Q74DRAFT_275982 [Fomes fomentarius]